MDELKKTNPKDQETKPLEAKVQDSKETIATKPVGLPIPEFKTMTEALQSTQIALDTYDDIFSDFDPLPYETRILSDDFLNELGKRYAETHKGELIVIFTIPKGARSEKVENIVKKRVKDYFKARHAKAKKLVDEDQKKGFLRVGVAIISYLPIIIFSEPVLSHIAPLLSVLAWYFLWTGLDKLLEVPGKLVAEMNFCDRFHRAKYNFVDEETVVKSIGISSGNTQTTLQ
jgi:hypothetical protein